MPGYSDEDDDPRGRFQLWFDSTLVGEMWHAFRGRYRPVHITYRGGQDR